MKGIEGLIGLGWKAVLSSVPAFIFSNWIAPTSNVGYLFVFVCVWMIAFVVVIPSVSFFVSKWRNRKDKSIGFRLKKSKRR